MQDSHTRARQAARHEAFLVGLSDDDVRGQAAEAGARPVDSPFIKIAAQAKAPYLRLVVTLRTQYRKPHSTSIQMGASLRRTSMPVKLAGCSAGQWLPETLHQGCRLLPASFPKRQSGWYNLFGEQCFSCNETQHRVAWLIEACDITLSLVDEKSATAYRSRNVCR